MKQAGNQIKIYFATMAIKVLRLEMSTQNDVAKATRFFEQEIEEAMAMIGIKDLLYKHKNSDHKPT